MSKTTDAIDKRSQEIVDALNALAAGGGSQKTVVHTTGGGGGGHGGGGGSHRTTIDFSKVVSGLEEVKKAVEGVDKSVQGLGKSFCGAGTNADAMSSNILKLTELLEKFQAASNGKAGTDGTNGFNEELQKLKAAFETQKETIAKLVEAKVKVEEELEKLKNKGGGGGAGSGATGKTEEELKNAELEKQAELRKKILEIISSTQAAEAKGRPFAGMQIPELEKYVRTLQSAIRAIDPDTKVPLLSKSEQQGAVDTINLLQKELNLQNKVSDATAQRALTAAAAATSENTMRSARSQLVEASKALNKNDAEYEKTMKLLGDEIIRLNNEIAKSASYRKAQKDTSKDAKKDADSEIDSIDKLIKQYKALKAERDKKLSVSGETEQIKAMTRQLDNLAKTIARVSKESGNLKFGSDGVTVASGRYDVAPTSRMRADIKEAESMLLTGKRYVNGEAKDLTAQEDADLQAFVAKTKETLKQYRELGKEVKEAGEEYKKVLRDLRRASQVSSSQGRKSAIFDLNMDLEELRKKGPSATQMIARVEDAIRRLNQEEARHAATEAEKRARLHAESALGRAESARTPTSQFVAVQRMKDALDELRKAGITSGDQVDRLKQKIAQLQKEMTKAVVPFQQLANEHKKLAKLSQQLQRKFATMFGLTAITGFIKSMVDVRANFELQQTALEAILQNKQKADEIFSKTVQLAVHSPFRIQQLITYTKQLAAYRIETDKLYDTTKRLADVSAGLGVDMQRLILAFGQVKSAAFLRGQEVRQFTEAGINIYQELKELYKDQGRGDFTTGQIVEMISKRLVTFEDVNEVFQRLTNEGGLFYNMQEIQAKTLRGRISNLKDSFDIMLNDMGKSMQGVISSTIDGLKYLLDHYEKLIALVKVAIVVASTYWAMQFVNSKKHLAELATMRNASDAAIMRQKFNIKNLSLVWKKAMVEMKIGAKSFILTLRTIGIALKSLGATMMRSLPTLAVMAVIAVLTDLAFKFANHLSALRQIDKDETQHLATIYKLAEAYDTLRQQRDKMTEAYQNAKAMPTTLPTGEESIAVPNLRNTLSQALEKNVKESEAALRRLGKSLSSAGLNLGIDKQLDKTADYYKNFASRIEKDAKELTDSLEEAAEDDKEAIGLFASSIQQVESALTRVYDRMTEEQKEAFDSARIKKEGERTMAYYRRYASQLKKVFGEMKSAIQESANVEYMGAMDKMFDDAEEKYVNFVTSVSRIKRNAQEELSAYGILGEDMIDDFADYSDAANEYIGSFTENINELIRFIEENKERFTQEQISMFNNALVKQEGESQIDFYERQGKTLAKIIASVRHSFNVGTFKESDGFVDALHDISSGLNDVASASEEAMHEIDKNLGFLKKKYPEWNKDTALGRKQRLEIKAIIDKYAVEQEIDDLNKALMYKTFNINVQTTPESIEKLYTNIDQELTKFFNSKTYKVNLEGGKNDGVEDLLKTAAQKRKDLLKVYQSLVENKEDYFKIKDVVFENMEKGIMVNVQKLKELESMILEVSGYGVDTSWLWENQREEIDPNTKEVVHFIPNDVIDKAMQIMLKNMRDRLYDLGFTDEDIDKKDPDMIIMKRIRLLKQLSDAFETNKKENEINVAATKTTQQFAAAIDEAEIALSDVNSASKLARENIAGLIETYSELLKKHHNKIEALSIAGQLFNKEDFENGKKTLDDVMEDISEIQETLRIYDELKKVGLSDFEIKILFPKKELVRDAKEARAAIEASFNEIPKSRRGEDYTKKRREELRKYDREVEKARRDETKQVLKDYAVRLDEQLQLDAWYFGELKKIRAKNEKGEYVIQDASLRSTMERNLTQDYKNKTAKNDWEDFKKGDIYASLFQSMDYMSYDVLGRIKDRLLELKEQMKDLDATQLKEIQSALDNVTSAMGDRHPFRELTKAWDKIKNDARTTQEIVNQMADRDLEIMRNEQDSRDMQLAIDVIKGKIDLNSIEEEQRKRVLAYIDKENRDLLAIVNQLAMQIGLLRTINNQKKQENAEDEQNLQNRKKFGEAIDNVKKHYQTMSKAVSRASGIFREFSKAFGYEDDSAVTQILDYTDAIVNLGDMLLETIPFLTMAFPNAFKTASTSAEVEGTKMSIAMNKALGWVGLIITAVQALTSFATALAGSHDKRLQARIDRMKMAVDALDYSLKNIQQSFDNAFDLGKLTEYSGKMKNNLEAQIQYYKSMIVAEEEKKDSDAAKIQEYKQTIQDLEKSAKEMEENFLEKMGGFGSEANFASAAESFTDVWMEAFMAQEDGLQALEDKWDEYFQNLLKKQLLARAARRYINPILEEVDKAVDTDNGRTLDNYEIERIQQLKDENLKGFNDYAENLMKVLGVSPQSISALSKLQQGISSLSESTGEVLASYLNSIRSYLATQQLDVSGIYDLLSSHFDNGTTDSPMVIELRSQTAYLKNMSDIMSSVVKSGHTRGGYGLKVFVD